MLNHTIAEGEGDVKYHLCHMDFVRKYWLSKVAPAYAEALPELWTEADGQWFPVGDLSAIREQLAVGGKAVRAAVRFMFSNGTTGVGPYSHPVHFLQHMLWHDGWHVGAIIMTLRRHGVEPDEDWEEDNVWAVWRS